jgi:hypothetical protein
MISRYHDLVAAARHSGVVPGGEYEAPGHGDSGANETCASGRITAAERFQPALRFLPEIVESAHVKPSFR